MLTAFVIPRSRDRLRKGKDEEDDKRRQHVLSDVLAWLEKH